MADHSKPRRDDEQPQPSHEAAEAQRTARSARAKSEAVLPLAERLRDKVRELLAENHFAELMQDTLTMAAERPAR